MTTTRIAGVVLRLAAFGALIWVAILFGDRVKEALGIEILPHTEAMAYRIILLSLLVYTLLLALPFVPGAEIGIALFAAFGAGLAPLVYGATVAGLTLAFVIGRMIPPAATCRLLRRAGLSRAADLVEATAAAPPDRRLDALLDRTGSPLSRGLARYRYVALALLVNMPGNVVIGGGGGLSLAAGLSQAYSTPGFLLTIAVAVSPVPIAVGVFGLML